MRPSRILRNIVTNDIWTEIALGRPLVHTQTGSRVHIVAIHHNSQQSIDRANHCILKTLPQFVCLELDLPRYRYISTNSNADDQNRMLLAPDLYASEMLAAAESAKKIGAIVKLIDVDPQLLLALPSTHPTISNPCIQYKLVPPKAGERPTALSKALLWSLLKLLFKGDIQRQIDNDSASLEDMRQYLRLSHMLNPAEYFYNLTIRNAIMVAKIESIVASSPTRTDIVLVVGKAHYFGINMLWDMHVANRKYRIITDMKALESDI